MIGPKSVPSLGLSRNLIIFQLCSSSVFSSNSRGFSNQLSLFPSWLAVPQT